MLQLLVDEGTCFLDGTSNFRVLEESEPWWACLREICQKNRKYVAKGSIITEKGTQGSSVVEYFEKDWVLIRKL